MLLLCCCGVCKPAPTLLLCVLSLVLRGQFIVCSLMEFACDEVFKTILDKIFPTSASFRKFMNSRQDALVGNFYPKIFDRKRPFPTAKEVVFWQLSEMAFFDRVFPTA